NVVQTQEWQGTFRAEFNNGGYTDDDIADVFTQRITTLFHIYKNVFIPNGLYHFARHQLTYGSGQDRRVTYNFFERYGLYDAGTLFASVPPSNPPQVGEPRFASKYTYPWQR